MLHNNNITHYKITRLCSVVVNLVSAVDTVFEELDLDLLLLLIPYSSSLSPSFLLSNTAILNENKKQQ